MDSHVTTFLSILRSVQGHDLESLVEEILSWVGATSVERRSAIASDLEIDVTADVPIYEPGGTRRTEKWAFECKNLEGDRISVQTLRDIESQMRPMAPDFDVLCLITPWRVTSLARSTSNEDDRLRIWDQEVLEKIASDNIQRVRSICEKLSDQITEEERKRNPPVVSGSISLVLPAVEAHATGTVISPHQKYEKMLASIPSGQKNFADYENAVIDVFGYLFQGRLGPAKPQSRTADETQRRDILFKNLQEGRFWRNLFHQFGSNFLIVDAKNYADPIKPAVVDEVSKYANEAIGRFILIVSRKGGEATIEAHQIRIFGGLAKTLIVVISDAQLLEMVQMKQDGQCSEDLLEDATDSLLIRR